MLRVVACGAAGVLGAGGPGRPRDRHTRASLGVVDLEARPCPPVPPAPSTPVGLGVLTCACASARSPAVPSAPSGALHTGGAGSLMCALRVDSLSGQAPPLPINFARNSPAACSNIEFASLELQCFWGISKNDHDKLRAKFGMRWCRCCPWAPQPGPVGQLGRLSETPVAFAGAKWVFLVHFSGAEVMTVSRLPCWGRAEVSLVSPSPPQCVLCAKKFALRGHNGPKLMFSGVLGEFFRGNAAGGGVQGEVFRGNAAGGAVLGEVFRESAVVGSCWANFVAP